jgi:heptosyltransferase II
MAANLYIQTAFLGDLCLAIPTLKRIKKLRPESPLVLVCRQGLGAFFQGLAEFEPMVDQVFEVEKGNPTSYQEVLEKLSGQEFEWIFCPHESFTSAWFQRNLKAKKKVGFKKWWNFLFFNERLKKPMTLPEAIRQMFLLSSIDSSLAKMIQAADFSSSNSGFLSPVPEWCSSVISGFQDHPQHQELIQKYHLSAKRVVFFPGSIWETKKWTRLGFQSVAADLEGLGYQVIFLGTSDERELCEDIGRGIQKPLVLAGELDLLQSVYILAGAKLAICNDSGGQHLASITGTPTLSIFGPTVLAQGFRPWNSQAMVAQVEGLNCRPCGRHGHKRCPIGTHACMKELGPEIVKEKALRLLTQGSLSH